MKMWFLAALSDFTPLPELYDVTFELQKCEHLLTRLLESYMGKSEVSWPLWGTGGVLLTIIYFAPRQKLPWFVQYISHMFY